MGSRTFFSFFLFFLFADFSLEHGLNSKLFLQESDHFVGGDTHLYIYPADT